MFSTDYVNDCLVYSIIDKLIVNRVLLGTKGLSPIELDGYH